MNYIHAKLINLDLQLSREAVNEFLSFKEAVTGKSVLGESLSWGRRLVSFGSGISLDVAYRIERIVQFVFVAVLLSTSLIAIMPFAVILSPSLLFKSNVISTFVKNSFSLLKIESKLAVEIFAGFLVSPMVLATKNRVLDLLETETSPPKKLEYSVLTTKNRVLDLLDTETSLQKKLEDLVLAANHGDTKAQVELGGAYLNKEFANLSEDEQVNEGITLLNAAVEKNNVDAMYILGVHYANTPSTLDKAIDFHLQAIALDSYDARFNLAIILDEENIDLPWARKLYQEVSDHGGDVQAKVYYAEMIYLGRGGEKNIEEAKTLLEEIVLQPGKYSLSALYHLSYLKLNLEEYDAENRPKLLDELKGSLERCLAEDSDEYYIEDAKNLLEVVKLEIAARKFNLVAVHRLLELDSVKANIALLVDLYAIGAILGCKNCIDNLELAARNFNLVAVHRLLELDSVKPNIVLLADLYEIGSALGCENCIYKLGVAYFKGEGREINKFQAFLKFSHAAELGILVAKLDIALMLCKGEGCVANIPASIEKFQELIDAKDPKIACRAKYLLAFMFSKGPKEHRNLNQAQKWLQELSQTDYPKSSDLLKEVEKMKKESSLYFWLFNK